MVKQLIRDFIYLDVERVRSYVAQSSGGLTSERTNQAQHQMGGSGQVEGGLPFIAKASGSADYHYLRSHSETKSLHDQIFEEFFHALKPGKHIIDLSQTTPGDWVESVFKDSTFIQTKGLLKIVDYQSIITTIQGLPTLLDTVGKFSTITAGSGTPVQNASTSTKTKGNIKGNVTPQSPPTEFQQLKNQLRNLPIKDFANLVTQIYGDLVRIKVLPFQSSSEKLFVGTADRALFRYSPSTLVNLYGSVVDAGWVCILQINKGVHHAPGQMVSKTGNDMEDSLEQMADVLSSLASVTQGIVFPAVAVTPIAIYREIE